MEKHAGMFVPVIKTVIISKCNHNERKTCLLNTKHFEFCMKSLPWKPFKVSKHQFVWSHNMTGSYCHHCNVLK